MLILENKKGVGMKSLSNSEILKKTSGIIFNRIVSIICIALSAGIVGIITQQIHLTRFMHAVVFGLMFASLLLGIYIGLFSLIYCFLYFPKAIRWDGVIHRLEYFLVMLTSMIIYALDFFIYAPERYGLEYKPTSVMLIIGFTVVLFLIYVQVCACIKRLNDLKWPKWLAIIHIIPIVSIAIRVPCLFVKGKVEKEDNFVGDNNPNQTGEVSDVTEESAKGVSLKEPLRTILIVFITIFITAIVCLFIGYKIVDSNDTINIKESNKFYKTKVNLKNSYWIPISETWSFDLNSIKQDGEYASIVSKNMVNERSQSGRFIKYMCYVDIFKKDTFEHKTALTIALDDNMKEIETNKFPYGDEVMIYPEGSTMETLRDIAFMPKKKINDVKMVVDMGMVDYFSPYIEVSIDESNSPNEI